MLYDELGENVSDDRTFSHFVEVCKRRGLKVDANKSKVIMFEREEESEWISMDGSIAACFKI